MSMIDSLERWKFRKDWISHLCKLRFVPHISIYTMDQANLSKLSRHIDLIEHMSNSIKERIRE